MSESNNMDFEQAVSIVMRIEGGYVNDPNDPGGETRWGISKRAFPWVNIKTLTEEQARSLYFTHYWIPAKCGFLPERIRLIFFDMCVLHGKYAATKTLQRALNGSRHYVTVDGFIGNETLNATPYLEPDRLRSYRILRIANIVSRRPSLEKYWFGWYRRAVHV